MRPPHRPADPPPPAAKGFRRPPTFARRLQDFLREQRGLWTKAAPRTLALRSRPPDGGTSLGVRLVQGCLERFGLPGATVGAAGGQPREGALAKTAAIPASWSRPFLLSSAGCGSITVR